MSPSTAIVVCRCTDRIFRFSVQARKVQLDHLGNRFVIRVAPSPLATSQSSPDLPERQPPPMSPEVSEYAGSGATADRQWFESELSYQVTGGDRTTLEPGHQEELSGPVTPNLRRGVKSTTSRNRVGGPFSYPPRALRSSARRPGSACHQTQRPRFSPAMSPASARIFVWCETVG